MFDYVAVGGTLEDRVIEYVDHLHEHFVDPVVVQGGRYRRADRARLLGAQMQARRRSTRLPVSRAAPDLAATEESDDEQ